MSSIRCPDCSTVVSGSQPSCPHCNFPISKLRGLSAAILTKSPERVAGLIQLGADVNVVDKNGRTPLMVAASIDSVEIVQMLLAAGAKPEFMNDAGETALSIAKSRDAEKIIRRAIVVTRFNSLQQSTTGSPQIEPVQPMISETPEQTYEVEKTQIEQPQLESTQQETSLDFDQSLKFTEVSAWENRIENLSPIEEQERQIQNEVAPQYAEEVTGQELFDFPILPNTHERAPIDLQLNEEIFETRNSYFVQTESTQSKAALQSEYRIEATQPFSNHKFQRSNEPRYFITATIGLFLLILLMALTWPRSSKPSVAHASRSLKPAKQMTKTEPQKQQLVPENQIAVHEEQELIEPIPESQVRTMMMTASSKPKSKAPITRIALMKDDRAKIRLGRALNSQGFSLIKVGRPGDAIPLLEKSLRSFPEGTKDAHYAYAMFNLGLAWRKAGRPDIAIPILEKRMKINNQRDVVARELSTARKEAKEAGFDTSQ